MTRKDEEASLKTEHEALTQIAEEDECYTDGRNFVSYIEGFYVGDYTPFIYQNLRFYRRKRTGKLVALYVNPKTHKGMKSPYINYLADVKTKIYAIGTQSFEVKDHIYRDIARKVR